jgi:hypothetical protein
MMESILSSSLNERAELCITYIGITGLFGFGFKCLARIIIIEAEVLLLQVSYMSLCKS